MSNTPEVPPAEPAKVRRIFPWSLLLFLIVIGIGLYSTVLVGRRAATLDQIVSHYQQERDNYVVGVCHEQRLLAEVPPWAAPLQLACRVTEPRWGTEEPATEAVAQAALTPSTRSGIMAALGRFIRTFNPVILLEIFVALTVAFFVLLGVRGGETPAETMLSRLGGAFRTKWISTAKRAALAGLLLGAGSLVAGTWASELREEKRQCRETAVSYAHLLGIDRRCVALRGELAATTTARDEALVAHARCEVSLAETSARMAANSSIEETAILLETKMVDEQDRRTKAVLDALSSSFTTLAQQLSGARADTAALAKLVAKEESLTVLAKQAAVEKMEAATKAGLDTITTEMARKDKLEALAKAALRDDTFMRWTDVYRARQDVLDAKLRPLEELKGRQCLQRAELDSALQKLSGKKLASSP